MNDYFENPLKRKYTILIIYDITNNKRRYRMVKLLKGYGIRVQRSAFECILTTKKYEKLIKEIEKLFNEEDLIRTYKLDSTIEIRSWGDIGKMEEEDVIII